MKHKCVHCALQKAKQNCSAKINKRNSGDSLFSVGVFITNNSNIETWTIEWSKCDKIYIYNIDIQSVVEMICRKGNGSIDAMDAKSQQGRE